MAIQKITEIPEVVNQIEDKTEKLAEGGKKRKNTEMTQEAYKKQKCQIDTDED